MPFPSDTDPDLEVIALIEREVERQTTGIQLIASENFTSPAVMAAVGSVLTNKYAEGYPGKRYYGGNVFVDSIEQLAIDRVKELFGADHANVQPHSGANANMCVYQALLNPGDTVLGLSLDHGGHLTHGSPVNASGLLYNFVSYGTGAEDRIDMDDVRDARARTPTEDDRRRHDRLPAPPRPRAVQEDRRRGRCAAAVRHRPPRRSRRGRRPSQPGAVRRRRDVHHPQDPARSSWRLHPLQGGTRQGHRQGGVPRLAGRPAGARHRRQGGRVPRGDGPVVQPTTPTRS